MFAGIIARPAKHGSSRDRKKTRRGDFVSIRVLWRERGRDGQPRIPGIDW